MNSLYHAYQTYEARAARGEFTPLRSRRRFPFSLVLEATLGDLMIRLGGALKKHALAGKPMAWTPLTGSKA